MNENIVNFLNGYLENPDPQYAVFLKGNWGCGKTFFINEWLKSYKKKIPADQVLEPVMVSLYGLSEIKQVKDALNRVLCPILYGKVAKTGKVLFKLASSFVLKHEVDLNNNGASDFEMNVNIDPMSLFNSDDDSVKKGKLLIFDDIERCDVPMKKLLGFLNYFVEQCHCHLIIIGDENKIADGEQKKVFADFKEKTIGREFEIEANVEDAIKCFIEQTPTNEFIVKHRPAIKRVFSITGCKNLRILRQALWDFGRFEETMWDYSKDERYEDVIIHVMGSYIITYCEYRGGSHDFLDKWVLYNFKGEIADKEEINQLRSKIGNLHQRYNNYHITPYQTFKIDVVEKIIMELNTGSSIKDYVKGYFASPKKMGSWERTNDSFSMENDEFLTFYKELVEDICNNRIVGFRNLGYVITYLVALDARKTKELSEVEFNRLCDALPSYFDKFEEAEHIYDAHLEFERGINSYMTNNKLEKLPKLCSKLNQIYEQKLKECKNVMTRTLENLSDSNVDDLCGLNEKALPDHSCAYGSVSIFNQIDIDLLFKKLKGLSNDSLQKFNHFIRVRYMLSYNMGNWINRTDDDIESLKKLKRMIDEILPTENLMRKEAFYRISNSLNGAIKRCNGDLHAM